MIYKEADDQRQGDLAILQSLREETSDQRVRNNIDTHLRNIRAGLAGEREVAYFLNIAYSHGCDVMVLHDLRFETSDGVAQIDHAVLNRRRELYILETKSMRSGMVRDREDGRWYRTYGAGGMYREPMPDPIEQGRRHGKLVGTMLRTMRSSIQHVIPVMVVMPDAKVTAERQPHEDFSIVATDQFASWMENRPTIRAAATAVHQSDELPPLTDDEMYGVASRLERSHTPLVYNWRGMVGMGEAAPLPTANVVSIEDHRRDRHDGDGRVFHAGENNRADPYERYVDQYVRRRTMPIAGGTITIHQHEDDMRTLRTEGPAEVRRSVSQMCKANGGLWIEAARTWLMTYESCKVVVDNLVGAPAPSTPSSEKVANVTTLPAADGPSIMRRVNGKRDLHEFHTDDGLVRVLKLSKDNYVLRTDANELNDVRIASVCRDAGVGSYYEQRNNWLIPHDPPEFIERVARAVVAFRHTRVDRGGSAARGRS